MSDISRSFILKFNSEIDDTKTRLHMSGGNIFHPPRNGRGEKKDLEVLATLTSAFSKDLVNFFLEALLEHLIGFIKDNSLKGGEVNVTSLNMVENATASSDEEVDTTAQSSSLIINVHTSIDSKRIELSIVMLQLGQLVLNL